jgi:hypothetical protein
MNPYIKALLVFGVMSVSQHVASQMSSTQNSNFSDLSTETKVNSLYSPPEDQLTLKVYRTVEVNALYARSIASGLLVTGISLALSNENLMLGGGIIVLGGTLRWTIQSERNYRGKYRLRRERNVITKQNSPSLYKY